MGQPKMESVKFILGLSDILKWKELYYYVRSAYQVLESSLSSYHVLLLMV